LRLAPQYAGRVQAGDPGLKPDEQGRLRNRALALAGAARGFLGPDPPEGLIRPGETPGER
jgi:hypothetical protein